MKPDYDHISRLEHEVFAPEDYDLDARIDEAVSEARAKRHNPDWKENGGIVDFATLKRAAATVYPVVAASSSNFVHIQPNPYAAVQHVRDVQHVLLYGT